MFTGVPLQNNIFCRNPSFIFRSYLAHLSQMSFILFIPKILLDKLAHYSLGKTAKHAYWLPMRLLQLYQLCITRYLIYGSFLRIILNPFESLWWYYIATYYCLLKVSMNKRYYLFWYDYLFRIQEFRNKLADIKVCFVSV